MLVAPIELTHTRICSEVLLCHKLITGCFGDLPIASCLVGSFASGAAMPDGDIDLLVCLPEAAAPGSLAKFRNGYFALHEALGRKPDREYPGEVFDIMTLAKALEVAAATRPSRRIVSPIVYDGIVWAGMLAGFRVDLITPSPEFDVLVRRAVEIIEQWAQVLGYGDVGDDVELDKILASEIVYAK